MFVAFAPLALPNIFIYLDEYQPFIFMLHIILLRNVFVTWAHSRMINRVAVYLFAWSCMCVHVVCVYADALIFMALQKSQNYLCDLKTSIETIYLYAHIFCSVRLLFFLMDSLFIFLIVLRLFCFLRARFLCIFLPQYRIALFFSVAIGLGVVIYKDGHLVGQCVRAQIVWLNHWLAHLCFLLFIRSNDLCSRYFNMICFRVNSLSHFLIVHIKNGNLCRRWHKIWFFNLHILS